MISVAWYRFRTTFRRRWGGYLSIILLISLVGGLAMASIAGARRTQSAFSTYLAGTNPSNLGITVFGGVGNGGGRPPTYSSSAIAAIARLPGVQHVEAALPIAAAPLDPDGAPNLHGINDIQPVVSADGLFFDQDRLAVTSGRMADPNRADEIVMTPSAARVLGVHVGEVIPYGIYTTRQQNQPGFGTARVLPRIRVDATLVGLVQESNAIVQDDIDQFPTFVFFTPALGRRIVAVGGQEGAITYGLRLDHGNGAVNSVEQEFAKAAPPGNSYGFHAIAPVEAKVDRTVKPLTIAIGVFGGAAALAVLLIGLQLISRQLRDAGEESLVLRSLGAGPTTIAAEGLLGILASIVLGSFCAGAIAVALSPLSPLGPVRPVFPDPGISFDWTVLGLGVLVLIAGLGSIAIVLAYRGDPTASFGARGSPSRATRRPCRQQSLWGSPHQPWSGCALPSNRGVAAQPYLCVQPCWGRPLPSR